MEGVQNLWSGFEVGAFVNEEYYKMYTQYTRGNIEKNAIAFLNSCSPAHFESVFGYIDFHFYGPFFLDY